MAYKYSIAFLSINILYNRHYFLLCCLCNCDFSYCRGLMKARSPPLTRGLCFAQPVVKTFRKFPRPRKGCRALECCLPVLQDAASGFSTRNFKNNERNKRKKNLNHSLGALSDTQTLRKYFTSHQLLLLITIIVHNNPFLSLCVFGTVLFHPVKVAISQ